jgi:nucleoside-diphosphate-sugar epimerase
MLQETSEREPSLAKAAVLITGAGGFIGSALVARLAGNGVQLRTVAGAPGDTIVEPPTHVRSVRADINDIDAILPLAHDVETIVHLAGPASAAASFADPVGYVNAHVGGTLSMLEIARRAGVQRFVYVSSAEVYGRVDGQPVNETAPPQPRSPYGGAKAAAENLVRTYANAFGISACVLRPFSVYGPGQAPYALVPTIVRQALESDRVILHDLRPVRDYCYVGDLIDAIERACSLTADGFRVFNIASGIGTSVRDLAQAIIALSGRRIAIEESGVANRPTNVDIFELIADIERARTQLGWSPKTSLEEGLRATIAAYCA